MTNPDETRAHEYGEQAAMRGLTRDDCPYRLHSLKAHWLRGWHAWHAAQPPEPVEATPEARAYLARLKTMLAQPVPVGAGFKPAPTQDAGETPALQPAP